MALKLKTPPEVEPITLEEARLHCKVETDTIDEEEKPISLDDTLIEALIIAAREYCETFQRRAYITQTWELWLDAFPRQNYIQLARPPLQKVDSIDYYDVNDVKHTISKDDYFEDTISEPGWAVLNVGASWPSTTLRPANGVCVIFTAGYGDEAEDVPQKVKQAMLLIIGAWYEQREDFVATGGVPKEIPFGAKALLWQERNF